MSDTPTQPPRPPKQAAGNILAAPSPNATRYRKTLIYGVAAVAAIGFGAMLGYGLTSGQLSPHAKKQAKVTKTVANDHYAGNANYAGVTKPLVPSASYATGASAPATPGKPTLAPVHTGPMTSQESKKAALRLQKAIDSSIFFTATEAPGTPAAGEHGQNQGGGQGAAEVAALTAAAQAHANGAAGIGDLGGNHIPQGTDQGLQQQKNSFVNKASASTNDYVRTPEQKPISKDEIQAGTIIPAALITGIDSNLPGEIIAQVSQNVYNSATGQVILIPQGTKIIGQYDSLIGFAQNRALIVWNRLILPNGNSIDLGGMIGTDQSGESGLHDRVNAHNLALFAAIGAATLLSIGPQLALSIPQGSNSGTNIYTTPAENLGNQANSLGQDLVNRQLDRPNTIKIRPGWPLNVLVNKDMVMKPYSP